MQQAQAQQRQKAQRMPPPHMPPNMQPPPPPYQGRGPPPPAPPHRQMQAQPSAFSGQPGGGLPAEALVDSASPVLADFDDFDPTHVLTFFVPPGDEECFFEELREAPRDGAKLHGAYFVRHVATRGFEPRGAGHAAGDARLRCWVPPPPGSPCPLSAARRFPSHPLPVAGSPLTVLRPQRRRRPVRGGHGAEGQRAARVRLDQVGGPVHHPAHVRARVRVCCGCCCGRGCGCCCGCSRYGAPSAAHVCVPRSRAAVMPPVADTAPPAPSPDSPRAPPAGRRARTASASATTTGPTQRPSRWPSTRPRSARTRRRRH